MHSYDPISIYDLLESIGEERTKEILADFTCPLNLEIERFLHQNAIDFAKRSMSVTYLVFDEDNKLMAYFTLTHKPALIPDNNISNAAHRRIERHARKDETTNSFTVSSFLIAQLGKNASYSGKYNLTGEQLMDNAVNILKRAKRIVGGSVIFLECEDNEKLLSFYQNEHNNYQVYGERVSESENITYKQLLRFF